MKANPSIIKQLQSAVIEHPNFLSVKNAILTHVQHRPNFGLQLVLGSTGVGKTTTIKVCDRILTNYVLQNPDLGLSPPLVLEAYTPPSSNKEFDWKAFYSQALRALGEPELHKKIDIEEIIKKLKSGNHVSRHGRMNIDLLRVLYTDHLNIRRPIAVLIDEINSFARSHSNEGKIANLDVLKGLANEGNTAYVGFGTLDAQSLLYLNAQLSRRVRLVHFKRYTQEGSDYRIFNSIINAILKKFSIKVSNELVEDKNLYFFSHSLGCVGIFIDWLVLTLQTHWNEASPAALTKPMFNDTRLNNIQLRSIARDIVRFEKIHIDEEEDFDAAFHLTIDDEIGKVETIKKTTSTLKPGIRKPVRDKVGL